MSKYSIILFLAFCSLSTYSQENDINFLIETIKDGYSGYAEKTSNEKFDQYTSEISYRYSPDTFRILSEITRYFGDPHLAVYGQQNNLLELCPNIKGVLSYLNKRKPKYRYEGYWINDVNNCILAFKLTKLKPLTYCGYVLKSANTELLKGAILIKIEQLPDRRYLARYSNPNNKFVSYLDAKFIGDSILNIGYSGRWRKMKYLNDSLLYNLIPFEEKASAHLIDSTTYVIKIPHNSLENTNLVDSIVRNNYELISNIENLIIDIRNNRGGTIRTYKPLFPFIYTNPITQVGGDRLYSKMVLVEYEKDLQEYKTEKSPDSSILAKKIKDIEEIKRYLGKTKFDPGDIIRFDSVKINPKNVGIIVNNGCLSAAEMMILDFKQSKKVLVFGEHTYGAIDHLDNFYIDLPSKKYDVSIPTLTRKIPQGCAKLDLIGIQPDIPISDSVSNWVDFVYNYYTKKKKEK